MKENIEPEIPSTSFHHLDYYNSRYNPSGTKDLIIPGDEKFDCVTLFSVFTHMWLDDIEAYLLRIRERLDDNGKVVLSIFIEDEVEREVENPRGYIQKWKGPMHCIRINRSVFEGLLRANGLAIDKFAYRAGISSRYVLFPA